MEDKRAVLADFSRLNIRRNLCLPFFPSFFASKKRVKKEQLLSALSALGKHFFELKEEKNAFKITAATFADLNKAANALFQEMNFSPIVLQPERQFLLQQNWSYFDYFHFNSEKEAQKIECNELPDINLPFFSEPLNETVQQLLVPDANSAMRILESIALSNALRLPLTNLSPSNDTQVEALFENIFFFNGESRHVPCKRLGSPPAWHVPSFSNATFFDFSQLWPTILTKPFYNVSLETIDCHCCKPIGIDAGNILPSSTVSAEFLQDGFYFDSAFPEFAARFHAENEGRERRERRMREFCLPFPPIGPFDRGSIAAIPLNDAIALAQRKKARVISLNETHWFCLKQESAVAKQIILLQAKMALLEREANATESAFLKEHGLNAIQLLNNDCDFLFNKAKANVFTRLLSAIAPHLQDRNSAFFDETLANAFAGIAALVLSEFQQFSQQQGSRVVLLQHGNALVKSEKPFSLIEQFSAVQKIPALIRLRN
ncbi:MAG: hypothetical protein Q8N60_04035 [Candidatus Diapherotrites archaeon]|nr:hypothetical protein [Candidatus Diapherotrites archaeon]